MVEEIKIKEKVAITPKEYKNNAEKIKDFIGGFFLTWLIIVVGYFVLTSIFSMMTWLLGPSGVTINTILTSLLIISGLIYLIIRYFKTKRYIAIGMLSSIVFLLLATGSCIAILAGI